MIKTTKMDTYLYFALIAAALAIYAMVDISMRRYPMEKKMLWFPIVVLVPLVGPIVYYARRKSIGTKATGEVEE